MIVEERIYTIHPGTAGEYLKTYEAEGKAIQVPILGHMVGYFFTEVGPLNQIIHMWAYENMGERERRRAELAADPRWQEFVKKLRPFIIAQENKILVPASFSPNP